MQLLYYSSYLGFILVFTAFYYSFIFYAIIYLIGTLTSLNYWKDPTSNINRYIDIVYIYSTVIYFTYLAYINSVYTYLYYIILNSSLYISEFISEFILEKYLIWINKHISNLPHKIHFIVHLLCIFYNIYLLETLYTLKNIAVQNI